MLHGNDAHPTAEAVYAAAPSEMPTISLRTVYQTLNDLAAMGEILQLDLGTGSARFDPNVDAAPPPGVRRVRPGPRRARRRRGRPVPDALGHPGFRVSGTEIVFRGRCADCAARPA